jgi:hypothetical protein
MTLLDHFQPPLSDRRGWHSFHTMWCTRIAAALNLRLPDNCFAEPTAQFGIEVDVATFSEQAHQPSDEVLREVATAPYLVSNAEDWTAPAPTYFFPFAIAQETIEVLVYDTGSGRELIGAIELVSPANKDRPVHRAAFVSKCETYLRRGIGLVIVDIVTVRKANLHNELLLRLKAPHAQHLTANLYAAAYRVVERAGQHTLDVWQETLALGGILPVMPLYLRGDFCAPVLMHDTYEQTCQELRISI